MEPARSTAWLRSHRVLAVVLLFAAAGLAYAGQAWWRGPQVSVLQVVRRDMVQTVVASGRIATPYRVEIGSQVTGVVTKVAVEEGQAVAAAQVLIELEAGEAQATREQARTAVEQAQAKLRQLREVQLPMAVQTARQAQVNLENAQRQYERQKGLFDKGFIGQAALDDSRKSVDLADSQLKSAQRQVETAKPQGSDVALAQAALAQAQANLDLAQARLGYTRILAPYRGTLIARSVERGDVVQPGKTLMVLAPVGETQAVVQIDERNLGLIRLGQQAKVSADAYPKQVFEAEVVYINPAVDAQTASVQVKLRIPSPPRLVTQDMTVSVETEIGHHPNALSAPAEALHDGDGPNPWVLRLVGGKAERADVKTGLRGAGAVEIVSGLTEGDLLIPANAAGVTAGRRVRLKQ